MLSSKIIPLSKVIIDTTSGEILLKSDDTTITIKGVDFENEVSKFSRIDIDSGKAIITETETRKSPDLSLFMVNMYNMIYDETQQNPKLSKHSDLLFNNLLNRMRQEVKKYGKTLR